MSGARPKFGLIDVEEGRGCSAGPMPDGDSPRTCATCKHWDPPSAPTNRDGSPAHGVCGAIDEPGADSPDIDQWWLRPAFTSSHYVSSLRTVAEFGCVLHEPAPDREDPR